MSVAELNQKIKMKCRDCEFEFEVETLREFHHMAAEHINSNNGFGYPNYEHVVEAIPVWTLGRK